MAEHKKIARFHPSAFVRALSSVEPANSIAIISSSP
jgi:hypothetical protein